jgi:hypothetical protein
MEARMKREKVREEYFDDEGNLIDGRTVANRKLNLKRMWDLHHEIARRKLLGQKNTVIAKELGCTNQTVSNACNSPIVREKINHLRTERDANTVDIANQIKELAPKALDILRNVIEDDSGEVPLPIKVKEANNLLDRAGYNPKTSVNHQHAHVHLTPDEISDIKKRAIEEGKRAGVVVDV